MVRITHTKELLESVVKDSFSMVEVMRKLDKPVLAGNNPKLLKVKAEIIKYSISTEHFLPQGNPKDRRQPRKLTDDLLFSKNLRKQGYVNSGGYNATIVKRLIALGKEYKCEVCGICEWNNKLLRLQLEHIDGDSSNNEKSNLAFLCPNCHSQTQTFGGKNKKRKESNDTRNTDNISIQTDSI